MAANQGRITADSSSEQRQIAKAQSRIIEQLANALPEKLHLPSELQPDLIELVEAFLTAQRRAGGYERRSPDQETLVAFVAATLNLLEA